MIASRLAVQDVTKSFHRRAVLRGVSLEAHRSEIVGIVGENGAGKSTLLRILVGLLRPDSGRVHVSGRLGYCDQEPQMLFIGIAATGLISAFFASSLIQRQQAANRRLVLCGYRAAELIVARLAVLLAIIAATALYTWLVLGLFSRPPFPIGVFLGLIVGAFTYGCYGLLVGTLFRRELESIFAILALVNIDAGWLQNPLYFQNAGSKWLIEALPAHYPSQVAYLSAFTSVGVGASVAYGFAYGATFLLVAVGLYVRRMRMAR